jgi:hypothetical protein
MYHDLFQNASFWSFLFEVDQDLASTAKRKGCSCGGRLHRADYPRKPRGGGRNLPACYGYRLSFCCDQDGCRKRTTPPSVRFLGRKIYLAAVVVLVAAMRQGPSARRVHQLSELFDIDERTIVRWRVFWREHFPQTAFWKANRGRLALRADIALLPRALLDVFIRRDDSRDDWKRLLSFLSPITITGGLSISGIS